MNKPRIESGESRAEVCAPEARHEEGFGSRLSTLDSPLPRFVQIEPVGQCNLRCRMCPIAYRPDGQPGSPPAFIAWETFCRLLDGFTGVEELQLQGLGEPMLHPRFFDMVRLASRRGIRVSTNSNCTLLTPARARACVDSGLYALHVSIDGATPETYEFIRVKARLSRVLRNLDRVVAARAALDATSPRLPQLRMIVVAMRRNLDELPALVALAHEHGVDAVFVQHLCHDYSEATLPAIYRPMRDFVDEQSLLHAETAHVAEVFAEAQRAADRLGVELRLPPIAHAMPRPTRPAQQRCDWPRRGAYLSYRGEAMPCCMVSTPDRANLGDMARDGVATVWNGGAYRAFRAALESDDPPEICRGCGIYNGTF